MTQAWALILLGALAGLPTADERILWHFDADTALRTAERTGRPIVVLKVRADVGPDVKT
jgi:hypothetical protein